MNKKDECIKNFNRVLFPALLPKARPDIKLFHYIQYIKRYWIKYIKLKEVIRMNYLQCYLGHKA